MSDFNQVIESLKYLKEDGMTTKRVKEKAEQIICLLKENCDESNIDKALRELEELDSLEIPSYDRTLIWDVISVLEGLPTSPKP